MKNFLLRILFFGSIFVLNALFIYIIDPYNLFFDSNFVENDLKKISVSRSDEVMPRGNAMWKLNEFNKKPYPNIIIGDSRAMGFDTDIIKGITDMDYYNFGIPGGNYKTIFDVFWFANERVKLKDVVIQVGFHKYNKRSDYNLIKVVEEYIDHPYKMFFKNWFFFDSFNIVKMKLFPPSETEDKKENLQLLENNLTHWDQVLQRQGYAVFDVYEYPDNYHSKLKEISTYCHQNDIHLTFIIFPSHPDYFNILEELKLSNDRLRFIGDIKELGETFDLSNSKKLTTNKELYYDLYHLKGSVVDSLTYEIWK